MDSKKSWKSKTVWLGILTAVAPLVPGFNEFVQDNPTAFSMILGALFTGLRLITKGKVEII